MWFFLFEHANSSLVPGFVGVSMRSCFCGGDPDGWELFVVGMRWNVMRVFIVWVIKHHNLIIRSDMRSNDISNLFIG